MKIVCEKHILLAAVGNVQRAVSGKSTIPALEGALLRAAGTSLFLAGYDLDIGITTTIEAQVTEPGEIVLNARQFADIVRRLPDDAVLIQSDERMGVKIKSGSAEFDIIGLSASDYPDIPSVDDGIGLSVPQNLLKGMIRQTLFAVAQMDASRPVYTGTLFEAMDDLLRLVSVDGSRMAMRCESVKLTEPVKFVVPGKTLSEVLKLLQDNDTPVFLAVGRRHAVLQIDGYAVISRLLDGEFLDYKKAIPQAAGTRVTVNTREMMEAVERVSLVINERVKAPLVCSFGDGMMHFSCSTSMGSANDTIYCRIDGETEEMGFNARFLIDALKNAESDELCLEFAGPTSPMKLLPPAGDSFLFLVLPVRMKK